MKEIVTGQNRNHFSHQLKSETESRSKSVTNNPDKIHAETIIVGGGVVGCAIAYEIASRGQDVLLLERSAIARGTSCAAAGMLAADSEDFAHPLMAKLARQSRELLIEQQVLMDTLSGVKIGLQRHGFLTPFRSYSELSRYKNNRNSALSADEVWWDRSVVQQEATWLNRDTYGAYYRPYESEILPFHLTKAYAESAQALGARVMEDIQGIRVLANEQGVQGITTSIGEMKCKHVIIAAGLQSEKLMRHVNLSLPVWSVKGEIAAVQFSDEHAGYRPDRTVYAEDIYIVPKANGEVWLGATSLPGRTDLNVSVQSVQKLLTAATYWVPGMKEARFMRAWAGVRPATPDGLPYIGECKSIPGLFAACGHYRNGILLSAITGRLIAELLAGKSSEELGIEALSPERLNRKGVVQ
ncbi:glycine oxidase ThiO [Paenibacillus sp. 1781tsa1]|uniref:glycine oxidase ThiO n=1 Tax=Paenibacillus sp. 1781tsa1 TaxID=2953810 RepID=UPI0020A19B7D|nr:glycine oxidase ThiO [Paenibacillus sp. 1781tsa1]MCP1184860.1 glycine oxidase ThiO [Paenibacillus sp. 1781tsa1]